MTAPSPEKSIRRNVTSAELRQLYQSIKSAETIGVFDAAEALGHDDVATALERLTDARARYERKHARALARNPEGQGTERERTKAHTRQQQVRRAMGQFDEYLAVLEKMVKIRRAVPQQVGDPVSVELASSLITSIPADHQRQLQALHGDNALQFLQSHYSTEPVTDFSLPAIYAVVSKGRWHLLQILTPQDGDQIALKNLQTRKDVVLARRALLLAAERGQLLRLRTLKKQSAESPRSHDDEIVLDESELIVLWSVVRDTGLLPNASEIPLIQKNEFRRRQFDRALKKMLIMQRGFNAAVRRKMQAFSQELALLEARKQTLPLREIEKRKLAIAREKRQIERAEGHFTKVMNCLHALDSRRS